MEKQLEIVLDSLEQKQQKVQQKLSKQEIEKMLNEQKNVLSREDINKFFTENLKKINRRVRKYQIGQIILLHLKVKKIAKKYGKQ